MVDFFFNSPPPGSLSQPVIDAPDAAPVNAPSITAADTAPPGPSPQSVVNDDNRGVVGQVRYPSDTPMYYMSLGINRYQRTSWANVGTLALADTIILQLPEQLLDQQHVTYDTVPIGIPGMAAMNAGLTAANGGSILNAIKQTIAGLPGATGSMIASVGQNIEQGLLGVLGTGITRGILASQGLAVNDYLTVLLRGPAYKQFQFSWKLSPRNAAESRTIKAIEILLKNAQAPGWSGAVGAFFTWPRIFNIKFRYAAENDNDYMGDKLFRFKPCVLTDLAVNYAPGGVPAFYGSSQFPEGIQLAMQFTELELWVNSSDDAQDAYGNPDSILGPSPFTSPGGTIPSGTIPTGTNTNTGTGPTGQSGGGRGGGGGGAF